MVQPLLDRGGVDVAPEGRLRSGRLRACTLFTPGPPAKSFPIESP